MSTWALRTPNLDSAALLWTCPKMQVSPVVARVITFYSRAVFAKISPKQVIIVIFIEELASA